MADEENEGYLPVLSADEKAYFDNGGAEKPAEKIETAQDDAVVEKEDPPEPEAKEVEPAEREEKKHTTVSHAALEEERRKRKELQAERDELRDTKARMEERFKLLQEAYAPAKPEEKPAPKTDEDIFGAVDHTRAEVERIKSELDKRQQADRQQQSYQQLIGRYSADVEKYRAETPDMMDAYAHVMKARHAELEALGIEDQQHREHIVRQEEMQVVNEAYKRGKNPAQVVYEFAKARGYAKKADPAAGKPAAAKLEAIAASQEASKSLSAAGGGATGGQMTLERLAGMKQDEFVQYLAKNPKTVDRLMGKV